MPSSSWAYKLAIGIGLEKVRRYDEGRADRLRAGFRPLAGAGAGAQQCAQADRHPPQPHADHRRGADLARPGALVHGAGRADAGSLGHDGDRQRRGGHAGRAHQAGFHRHRQCAQRGALSDEGEILVRGPNVFMGYLNQPEKTAETIDAEGWLHTGDVGTVDGDGFFRISDRLKDIIITAGGKNITPSEIENQIKFSPYVTDAVVIGDKKPYLVCLIMIDQENVEKFAQDNDVPFSNYASLTRAPEVQKLIEGEIERVNKQFARVEQVKKFRLIERSSAPRTRN
jgi:acyl-CoA synthetase (AMP-forming)/AMP-acid ligase II